MPTSTRPEHDFLGELPIPNDAYYGIQTLRALENFHITGIPIKVEPLFVQALAFVKKGAALANKELGVLDPIIADYIAQACDRVASGEFDNQFLTDMIQGGAGTSVNMNANEVIANVALELMGHQKGEYQYCHPNNHVNCSQSTNDAYPTAFRIALNNKLTGYRDTLSQLADAFFAKGEEFQNVLKMGRTQLQDAVPMSMGDEFNAFATNLREELLRIDDSRRLIAEINMGATAIGTGINTPPGYAGLVTKHLRTITGLDLSLAGDLIEATYDTGAYVQLSGVLKRTAVKLSKICNDLRLLSSGPRCGINEINLPALQPGSSIMPGKVNPTQCEAMTMVSAQVMGNDVAITVGGSMGHFELNVFKPVMIYNFLHSARLIGDVCMAFNDKCAVGIAPILPNIKKHVDSSLMLVTALNPHIGYYKAAEIAQTAHKNNSTLKETAVQLGYVTPEQFDEWLKPGDMVGEVNVG